MSQLLLLATSRYVIFWGVDYVLLWMILNKFVPEMCRCLEYRDPENKHGVFSGDNFKTRKYNENKDKNDNAAHGELNVTVMLV